jgi:hypothetical protein
MATITHKKVNETPDDLTLLPLENWVFPSDWNDPHDITLGADENFLTDAQVSALHTQGTDAGLDTGGGHAVTAETIVHHIAETTTAHGGIPSIAGLLDETAHDILDHTGLTGVIAYTHPTGAGNLHVPTSVTTTDTGKVLTAGATAGDLSWVSAGGHTQGTDTGLDTGGSHAVTAETIVHHIAETSSAHGGIPSIAGLLDESAHDGLDHTGLTGVPAAYTHPTGTGNLHVPTFTNTVDTGKVLTAGATNTDLSWVALAAGHTQGTDTGLDTGGGHAVTAETIVHHIDNVTTAHNMDDYLEGKKDKHGWNIHPPVKTELSIAKPVANWIFTLDCGASFEYYVNGVEVIVTGTKTYDLGTTPTANTALHYLFFDDVTGTIKHRETAWNLYTEVPICTCFFNGTTWAITEERHYAIRDRSWHLWAHQTIGSRLGSLTDFAMTLPSIATPNDINIAGGTLYDEDLENTPSASTGVRLWYKTAVDSWSFVDSTTTPYETTVKFTNDAYTQTDVGAAKFINQWWYATPDIDYPIYVFREKVTAEYNTVALARAVTPPSLASLGFTGSAEVKLLYRLIWKGDDTLQEITDYRASSPIAGGATGTSSAAATSYSPTAPETVVTVQGALDNRPNYNVLGALSTGFLKVATTTGALTSDTTVYAPLASPVHTGVVETPAIKITTGAGLAKILTSDADGDATWETPAVAAPSTGSTLYVYNFNGGY